MKNSILTFLLFLVVQYVAGAPTITPTGTPGSCPADGSITVTATGTSGSVFYSIKKTTDAVFPPQQTGTVFYNLASGTYLVAVYDASGTTISSPISLTNAPYTAISVSNKTTGNAVITACDPDGSINMTITGGNAPYTYHLKGGPTSKPDVINSLKTVSFTQLETGTYAIDITDACGSSITVSGFAVTSLYNLNGITLGSLEGMGSPTVTYTGCDAAISFSTNNILLKDNNNNVLFQRDVKHMPAGYPIEIRVEYPAGSGIYTPWQNAFISVNLPNYRVDKTSYRVEMRHPCNTSNVVKSPTYFISDPFSVRSGFCSPTIVRTTAFGKFDCGTIHIHLDKITGTGTQSKSYDWDGSGTVFEPNFTGLNGTYAVNITVGGGTYRTSIIESPGTDTTATNMEIGGTLQSVTVAANVFDYPSTADCDFATGNIRSYINGGFPPGNTTPITYSILSGPELRDPVTSTAAVTPLWAKLQPGTYTVLVDYGGCRTETKIIPVAPPYSGFDTGELSLAKGNTCGAFKITGKGWYIKTSDGSIVTTAINYVARVLNADGTAILGAGTSDRNTVVSNAPFTIPYEVGPGTYKVIFASGLGTGYKCNYVEKYITIPPYAQVTVDVAKSGGLVCPIGFGELHIEAINGSGLGFTYRIKPKGSADASYTAYQPSPDFSGMAEGIYTVQVNDACGYTITQDLTMTKTASASSIRVAGADTIAGVAYACPGSTVQLNLAIIGKASNVKWTKPDGSEVLSDTCIVTNVSATDLGTYSVAYESGGCSWSNSIVLNSKLAPTAILSGSTAISAGGSATLSVALTGSAPWTIVYHDGIDTTTVASIASSPYTFTVTPDTTTTYTLISVTDSECSDTTHSSAKVKIKVVPTIVGTTNICDPMLPVTYTTEAGMTNYSWTVTSGTIQSGAGTNQILVQWTGASGTGSISVSYNDTEGDPSEVTSMNVTYGPLQDPIYIGDAPNTRFKSLKEAADFYNLCGLIENTSYIIVSDLEETETAEFLGTAPNSTLYTLTLKTDGTRREVEGNIAGPLVQFTAANNITIDGGVSANAALIDGGNDNTLLAFNNTNPGDIATLEIRKDASNNDGTTIYVKNASFSTDAKTADNKGIHITTNSVEEVSGCHVSNVASGIFMEQVLGGLYKSNVIRNTESHGITDLVSTAGSMSLTIINNDIKGITNTGTDPLVKVGGILVQAPNTSGSITIHTNTVSEVSAVASTGNAYGILVNGNGMTYNNMISDIEGKSAYGIFSDASGKKQEIYHNTVSLLGSNQEGTTTTNMGYIVDGSSDLRIKNNLFVNTDAVGTSHIFEGNTLSPLPAIFFNRYEITSGKVGNIGGTSYNMVTWKTAADDNSLIAFPQFVSNTNLHLSFTTLTNPVFRVPLLTGLVESDFDGEARDFCSNRAGADTDPSTELDHYATTWSPKNNSTDWNNSENWDLGEPHMGCSDAIILGGLSSYPELDPMKPASCDTIFFRANESLPLKDSDGEVAKTYLLDYLKAKVDLSVTANRWWMVAPPLRNMYSGDFLLDASIKRLHPATYIQYYQTISGGGSWLTSHNTKQELAPGFGYCIWVDDDLDVSIHNPHTYHFPKDSTEYQYFSWTGDPMGQDVGLVRGSQHRFVYEEGNPSMAPSDGRFTVNVTSDASGYANIALGNPYMSHLDFNVFYTANQSKIQKGYQIWGGSSFNAVLTVTDGNISTDDNAYIAPMQSFVVEKVNPSATVGSLEFTPEMSVTKPGASLRASQGLANLLKVDLLQNNERKSGIALHYKEGEKNDYNANKDVWTLFPEGADTKNTSILYSPIKNKAASIRTIGDWSSPVSLAIRSNESGSIRLRFSGIESFGSGMRLLLEDRLTGRIHELKESFVYEFDKGEGNVTNRFFVRSQKMLTGIEQEYESGIVITSEKQQVIVSSELGDPILRIEIYNVQGQLIVGKDYVSESRVLLPVETGAGVVIVKVKTTQNSTTEKVIVNK